MCNVYVWKSEKLDEKSDARHYIKSVKIYVYIYRGREDNINRRLVVATSYRANNSQLKKEMNFYCTRTQLVTLERHRIQTQLFRFRTESHSFSDRIRIFRSMRVSIVGRKKRTEGMQKPGRLGSSRPSLSRYIYIYMKYLEDTQKFRAIFHGPSRVRSVIRSVSRAAREIEGTMGIKKGIRNKRMR